MQVIKRDGALRPFDYLKIQQAIHKAGQAVGYSQQQQQALLAHAQEALSGLGKQQQDLRVCQIEQQVEDFMMSAGYYDAARAYIAYKTKRKYQRDTDSLIMRYTDEAINLRNVENENANMSESIFTAKLTRISNEVSKEYAKQYLLPAEQLRLHEEGWIYIHDFNSYAVGMQNCMFLDFADILENGFMTGNGAVRQPKTIRAAMQLVAVVFQCQSNHQFGGVSANKLDWDMAPYVEMSWKKHLKTARALFAEAGQEAWERYADHQTWEETLQAAEALVHNLNTLESRAGNQLPFTSVNYGTCTSKWGRLFVRAMLEATLQGVGELGTTAIFPIQIWQFMREPDGSVRNEDLFLLSLSCTSKRVYPNYVNVHEEVYPIHDERGQIIPDLIPATMGCRTRLGANLHGSNGKSGRGNLSPVTLNLPKIALESGSYEDFEAKVHHYMQQGIQIMDTRLDWQQKQLMKSAPFMYRNRVWKHELPYVEDCKIGPALLSGTLALGFIGLAEAFEVLFGQTHVDSPELHARSLALLKGMKQAIDFKGLELQRNISLYATPAEGLSHKFAELLNKQYGDRSPARGRKFLTNSFHVPVWKELPFYEKIALEAPFHKLCTGGSITYVELNAAKMEQNIEAMRSLVEGAMAKGVYYFAVNLPMDTCLSCGCRGLHEEGRCPECGSEEIQYLRRVTGYITGSYKERFNDGKKQEVEMRVKHG